MSSNTKIRWRIAGVSLWMGGFCLIVVGIRLRMIKFTPESVLKMFFKEEFLACGFLMYLLVWFLIFVISLPLLCRNCIFTNLSLFTDRKIVWVISRNIFIVKKKDFVTKFLWNQHYFLIQAQSKLFLRNLIKPKVIPSYNNLRFIRNLDNRLYGPTIYNTRKITKHTSEATDKHSIQAERYSQRKI